MRTQVDQALSVACSERELEVLSLVAQGATNQEIASELYISDATVRTHIQHLRMKLQARNRIQLALLARDHGVLAMASRAR